MTIENEIFIDKQTVNETVIATKGLEDRVNLFLNSLYENGEFKDRDVISYIENPSLVRTKIIGIGRTAANQFQLSSQKELLNMQALSSGEALEKLAKDIFNYQFTRLKFEDVVKAISLEQGVCTIDRDKVKETVIEQNTIKPSKQALNMLNVLNLLVDNVNEANKLMKQIKPKTKPLQIEANDYILGGYASYDRTYNDYKVDSYKLVKDIR